MSVPIIKSDLIQDVLDKFDKSVFDDYSNEINIFFQKLLDINDTEDDYIVFYCVFRDLSDNVFTIDEIYKYLEDNELELTIANIDKFLNDRYNSSKYQKQRLLYQKIMFGQYDQKTLAEWISDRYNSDNIDPLIENTISNISNNISRTFLINIPSSTNTSLLTVEDRWLMIPKIDPFELTNNHTLINDDMAFKAFQNIREADYQYNKLLNYYNMFFNKMTSFKEGQTPNITLYYTEPKDDSDDTVDPKYFEYIKERFTGVENAWFLIDHKEPLMLKAPSIKALYSSNHHLNSDLIFMFKRYNFCGLTAKEWFDLFVDFTEKFTEFLMYKQFDFESDSIPSAESVVRFLINDLDEETTLDFTDKYTGSLRRVLSFLFKRTMLEFFSEYITDNSIKSKVTEYLTNLNNLLISAYKDMINVTNYILDFRNYCMKNDKRFQDYIEKKK